MYRLFIPNEYKHKVTDITPQMLKKRGVKGIITDLDNTLIEWDRPGATPALAEWFKSMQDAGIRVVVVSNNNEDRVRTFAVPLGIPFIHRARKPLGGAYKRALAMLGVPKHEAVMIGDQMLTDVFGGNLKGLHTILVIPVAESDGFVTRFNRLVERRIMKRLKRKGHVTWEDNYE
ncbi:YqeG family HAD IIIA-type phosphatase [Indiicoccus explosivorum]|uniref:YqeG family HAD IIIA-type phosphatase n=1 Tax=Indiicoccus explosivorum TaxID=1917864 RepID=UPI000B4361F6|nr:YqeG family HAD IIIA-type phosphatase [Indiicoccus explosivorum]